VRVTFVGHSTALIELDGVRVLTDPVLRGRILHIVRHAPAVDRNAIGDPDVVVISHMHHDHFDPPSLRSLADGCELIVPRGGGQRAERLGFESVTELGVGEGRTVGVLTITATHAEHRRGRHFDRRSEAIGYTIAGTQAAYFAGDTDIFDQMRELRGADLALLPVSGWGPKMGPGHLDPERAAESLTLLEPRVAVPIHWGTLSRVGLRRAHRALSSASPHEFATAAARVAPAVDVRVLEPGKSTVVEPAGGGP
jgi:L-ascorbate metabolism protein UlaG (beta-lactamase superfamily)